MWQSLKKRLVGFNSVVGIEVDFQEQSTEYRYVLLNKTKNRAEQVKKGNLESPKDLRAEIPKDTPIALIFSGKGILHKKKEAGIDFETQMNSLFPNGTFEDFAGQSGDNWISLVRKERISQTLAIFKKEELKIISLNIGSLAASVFKPLLGDEPEIPFGNTVVKFEKPGIQIKKLPDDENISFSAVQDLEFEYYPAFAAGLNSLLGIENQVENIPELSVLKGTFEDELIFKKVGWVGLISFLVILLINFYVFSNFSTRNEQLSYELAIQGRKIQTLDSLSREVENYTSLESRSNLFKLSQTSFYADEIGISLPEEILLSSLNIFPAHRSKKEKKLNIDFEILLNGSSAKSSVLNAWINELKELEWVAGVEVLPYSESSPGKGEFELRITPK